MYSLARALLFQLDAERAHRLVMHNLGRWPLLAKLTVSHFEAPAPLKQTILGHTFSHPVGLAAGLDKDGIAIRGMFQCGFSSVEVGTVTPLPQPGNEQPRLFRLKQDEALINRMGFNNHGSAACAAQIRKLPQRPGIIGVNIGKNKITPNESAGADYMKALLDVVSVADYITVNLSSPNTPGLRDLQSASTVKDLCKQLEPTLLDNNTPVFIKLSPDLSEETLIDIIESIKTLSTSLKIGIIATNTTVTRENLQSPAQHETGGLSGKPLTARSTKVIQTVWRASGGQLPIIGCGGIFDAADAYEKIRAGASLLQIYTAFIYRGPTVVREIVSGLDKLLKADGFNHISEAVGCDVR